MFWSYRCVFVNQRDTQSIAHGSTNTAKEELHFMLGSGTKVFVSFRWG
jgi:hypothetical protein